MRSAIFVIVSILLITAFTCIAEDTPQYTTNNAFSISLIDGSVLLCNPQFENLPVQTAYADLTVPLTRINTVSNDVALGESIISMENGDVVRGRCGIEQVTVISLLGKLIIPMKNITEINSNAKRKRVFNDSPAARNACINNLRIIDSAKEQWALASRKASGAQPVVVEINHYIKGDRTPVCPAGGEYAYGVIGVNPTCDCPGHAMPGGF